MADQYADTPFSAEVNDMTFTFIQSEIDAADVVEKSNGQLHLLNNHTSVQANVLATDNGYKDIKLEIEGEVFHVQLKDELDLQLDQMGLQSGDGRQVSDVKAPMPGLVLQIDVEEGQKVTEGDKLLILVAMKMENIILAPQGARVKKIHVAAGVAVNKGQVLIELDSITSENLIE